MQVEVVALRRAFESGHETTDQPGGRRAENAEPEDFDVARPGIEAVVIDDRVEPGTNSDDVLTGRRRRNKILKTRYGSQFKP